MKYDARINKLGYKCISFPAYGSEREEKLLSAALKGDVKEVRRLIINEGANINAKGDEFGETPLMNAATQLMNSIELIGFLLRQKDIDVNATNHYGKTASQLLSHDEIINKGEQF